MEQSYVYAFVVFVVVIVLFLICRELVCWYFKINHMARRLDEIEAHTKNLNVLMFESVRLQRWMAERQGLPPIPPTEVAK